MNDEAAWDLLIFPQCGRADPQWLTGSKSREAATAALPAVCSRAAAAACRHAHAHVCSHLGTQTISLWPSIWPEIPKTWRLTVHACSWAAEWYRVGNNSRWERFDGGLFLATTYGGVPGAVLHSGFQVVVSHFLLWINLLHQALRVGDFSGSGPAVCPPRRGKPVPYASILHGAPVLTCVWQRCSLIGIVCQGLVTRGRSITSLGFRKRGK